MQLGEVANTNKQGKCRMGAVVNTTKQVMFCHFEVAPALPLRRLERAEINQLGDGAA